MPQHCTARFRMTMSTASAHRNWSCAVFFYVGWEPNEFILDAPVTRAVAYVSGWEPESIAWAPIAQDLEHRCEAVSTEGDAPDTSKQR